MKRKILILSIAALCALGVLFLNLIIGRALSHQLALNTPWPFIIEGLVYAGTVGYIFRSRGWLMGMLAFVALYTLLFLIVSLIIFLGALDEWSRGGSVLHLIRMNISVYGILNGVQSLIVWIFLPSLAVGAVGGAFGEIVYKKSNSKKKF